MIKSTYDLIIIGAGFAGTYLAHCLKNSGLKYCIISQGIADGASGNKLALVTPYLSSNTSDNYTKLLHDSFFSFKALQKTLPNNLTAFYEAIQFPSTVRLKKYQGNSMNNYKFLSQEEISKMLGTCSTSGGWYLPDASAINPEALCSFFTKDTDVIINKVSNLEFNDTWKITTEHQVINSKIIVICNAHDIDKFQITKHLPVEKVYGQLLYCDNGSQVKTTVCFDGYLTPGENYIAGAYYQHGINSLYEAPATSEQVIIDRIKPWLPEVTIKVSGSRSSFRCSTHDRIPYIGKIPDFQDLELQKSSASFKRNGKFEVQSLQDAYCAVGFGSRGVMMTSYLIPLLAEEIITGKSVLPDFVQLDRVAHLNHKGRKVHKG